MIQMDETEAIRRYLGARAGALMVDVGAHHGGVCRPFLQHGWNVLAFEPDPVNRKELERLTAEFQTLTIDPRAVSDAPAAGVTLYRSAESTGVSSLTAFTPAHAPGCRVDAVTLTAALSERGIRRAEFLKVDVEGLDLDVLRGFPWESIRPDVVIAEFEDRKTQPRYGWRDMAEFLKSRQYDVMVSEWKPIEAYGREHAWSRFAHYPCELEQPDGWGNIVGFRDGIDWPRWTTATAATMGQELESCRQRTDKLRARGKQRRAELHDLQARLAAIERSRLWRILRQVRRLLPPRSSAPISGS